MSFCVGLGKFGRDKSSGLHTEYPSVSVQVGMEGDGAWPAEPACLCPGLSKINSISAMLKLLEGTLVRNPAVPDLRVLLVEAWRVGFCPTRASRAAVSGFRYDGEILSEPTAPRGSVRDRLVVALADPEVAGQAGRTAAALVAFHEPMAVFEWLGTGRGLVLLDRAGIPEGELRVLLDRVLGAHEKGLLFVVVAGGGAEVVEALRAADAAARNRDHIGLYHAEETGQIHRVAGRRLPDLEKAGRALPETGPLSPEKVAAIVERGRRERLEAMEFVRSTAHRFPHLTVAYIAICFLLFALTSGNDVRAQQLFALLCNRPDEIAHGELWRLLTYALLHNPSNPTHLIVNMLSLYSLGSFLEPMLGRRRMGLLCAATALAGGAASALFTHAISVGASGAVWGLLGATFGLLQRKNPGRVLSSSRDERRPGEPAAARAIDGRQQLFPALIARRLRQQLVVILAINIAISFLPGIDRYCHFGGGLCGYVLARYFARGPARSA